MTVFQDVINDVNKNPLDIIWYAVFIFFILVINWLWREVISDLIKEHTKKKLEKAINEKEEERKKLEETLEKISRLEAISRKRLHKAMVRLVQSCFRDGWRNDWDRELIENLYDDYVEVGGNHDGKGIIADFYNIPYKTERKLPQKLGYNYPDEEMIDIMNDYFDGVSNKLIPKETLKPIKNVININKKGE